MRTPSLKKRLITVSALLVLSLGGLTFWLSDYLLNHFKKDIALRNLNLARAVAEHTDYLLSRPVQELAKLLELLENRALSGDEALGRELRDILRFNPFFELIQLLDEQGRITHLAPHNPDQTGLDLSNHPSFFEARDSSRTVWSDGFISSQTGALSATVSVPFNRGVIVAQLNLEHLSSILQTSAGGKGGFTAVTDTRGMIIAHTRKALLRESVNIANLPSLQKGLKGEEGSWDEVWENTRGLSSVSTIAANRWVVIVFQPESESKGVVKRVERLTLLLITTAFTIALITAYLIMLRLLNPVRKLEEQSRKVAEGSYGGTLTPDYREFISVCDTFNTMAARIRLREEELIESEQRFRQLAENIFEVFWIVSPDWSEIIYISPAFETVWGRSRASLMEDPSSWPASVHPEDRSMVKGVMGDAKTASLAVVRFPDYRIVRADGEIRWLSTRGFPVRDKAGKTVRIVGITSDISERKNSADRLLESEEKYRTIFDGAREGILLIEPGSLGIHFSNPAMGEILGYSGETLETLSVGDLCPPEAREELLISLNALSGPNRTGSIALPFIDADGETRHLDISASTVNLKGERFIAGFFTDITRRQEMEMEKERLELQLLQTQKMEAIGVLAGGIAHDFNNILSPILGYAEMLDEDLPAGIDMRMPVGEIMTGALRARDLVKQILAFSRQSEEEVKPIRLQHILEEAMNLLRSSIPATITIDLSIDSSCGAVLADSTRIHQVVMNLATNAYHAMQESGGRLTVSLGETPSPGETALIMPGFPNGGQANGPWACISVSDTGKGIERAALPKIFEPYFTTKSMEKGTGLGLSVVHGIVKTFGGTIKVESEQGKGSVFRVFLPIVRKAELEEVSAKTPVDVSGSETIMLVDDETAILHLERQVLRRNGYKVHLFPDAVEALGVFMREPGKFDLVVTDMTMPGLTGDALAEGILKVRPGIPVIICTGYSEKINRQTAEAMGIKGFLEKPLKPTEFLQTVRKVLNDAGTAVEDSPQVEIKTNR